MYDDRFAPVDIPLLALTALLYLKTIDRLFPMGKDLVSTQDMDGQGNYFVGAHELTTSHILTWFSNDVKGLVAPIASQGGKTAAMGFRAGSPSLSLAGLSLGFWDLDTGYQSFLTGLSAIFSPLPWYGNLIIWRMPDLFLFRPLKKAAGFYILNPAASIFYIIS